MEAPEATEPGGLEEQFDDAADAPIGPPGGLPEDADTQPTVTQEPETETPDGAPDVELPVPFRLADVPEDQREHVQRYIDSAKPAVTRAFQEAAEVRRQAEEALELQQALDSPDSAYKALSDLLDRYNLELDRDSFDQALAARDEPEAEDYDAYEADMAPGDEALGYLLERERAREQAEREQYEQQQNQQMRSAIDNGLAGLTKSLGYKDGQLPDPIREDVLSHALAIPPLADGMPDMKGAIERYKAAAAVVEQRYLQSKQTVTPPTGGSPGEKRLDIRDDSARLRAANDIARRRVG